MSGRTNTVIKSAPSLALGLGLALAGAVSTANATPFNSDPAFQANILPNCDDCSSSNVTLPFTFDFFGMSYSSVFVNTNGDLTYGGPLSSSPDPGTADLASNTTVPILAPFFADVDTTFSGATCAATVPECVNGLVTYGDGMVNGHDAFGVDWNAVAYFNDDGDINKLDTFQVIIVDRSDIAPGDADIYYDYSSIQWESGGTGGDDSGGDDGLGGASADVGYSNGGSPVVTYEFPGSGIPGTFPNGGTTPLVDATNDGVPGQLLFQVRNGIVTNGLPPTPAPEPASLTLFGSALIGLGVLRRRRKAS